MKKRVVTPLIICFCAVFLCGFTVPNQTGFVEDLEKKLDIVEQSEQFNEMKQQWDAQYELQQTFEKEVDRMIRAQDDLERSVVLGAQNLNTKKKLTKEEKKKFLSVYQDMPKTVDEYLEMSKDIKRSERKVEPPQKAEDEKFEKLPEPRYLFKKYNKPAGVQNINLRLLITNREVNSIGVVSPNKDKMAYTRVYYSGYNDKVSSEVFYVDLDMSKSPKNRVQTASFMNKNQIKLMDSALNEEYPSLFKTLTIIDWSEDATKLAIKERIGSSVFGMWQTNLWVYDLNDNSSRCLTEVREAVKYQIRKAQNINIDDYRWDIVPLGWDAEDKDRIIVCAYAYTKNKSTKFLGLYSIDIKGDSTLLISDKPMAVKVGSNGLMLKAIYD